MKGCVYVVECFDSRNEGAGCGLTSRPMGSSMFIANGGCYTDLKNARRCADRAKKNGLSVSIRSLLILDGAFRQRGAGEAGK
jgi:hypothetical protein